MLTGTSEVHTLHIPVVLPKAAYYNMCMEGWPDPSKNIEHVQYFANARKRANLRIRHRMCSCRDSRMFIDFETVFTWRKYIMHYCKT